MSLFHDEEDGNPEPIAGLPEKLPEGENIEWQGKPAPLTLAVQAFRIRLIAAYVVLFGLWRVAAIASQNGSAAEITAVITTSILGGIVGISLFAGIAWLMARSTIYTITNKRVVLRYGVALRKYINLPFSNITAAALKQHSGDTGSIALNMEKSTVGYLHLWPHARPFRFSNPEPMLRALPNLEEAANILCRAMKAQAPQKVELAQRSPVAKPTQAHGASPVPAT